MAAETPVGLGKMSTAEMLRGLVVEKLTIAAQEIFATVERTVAAYEEEALGLRQEIDRQKKLLEGLARPEIKVETTEHLPVFQPAEGGERGENLSIFEPSTDIEDFGIRNVISYNEEEEGGEKKEKSAEEPVQSTGLDQEHQEDEDVRDMGHQEDVRDPGHQEEVRDPGHQEEVRDQEVVEDPGQQTAVERKGPLKLRVGLMQTSKSDSLLEDGLKSPLQEVRCPRGLQEPDFLDLLRSTFPQLTGPFKAFTSDATGKSALFIRVKAANKPQKDKKKLRPHLQKKDDNPEEGSSTNSPADKREGRKARQSRKSRRKQRAESEERQKSGGGGEPSAAHNEEEEEEQVDKEEEEEDEEKKDIEEEEEKKEEEEEEEKKTDTVVEEEKKKKKKKKKKKEKNKEEEEEEKKEEEKKDDVLKPDESSEELTESKAERRRRRKERRREERKALQSAGLDQDPGQQLPNADIKQEVMTLPQKRPLRVRQNDGSSDCSSSSLPNGAPPEKMRRRGVGDPEPQAGPLTEHGLKTPLPEWRLRRAPPDPEVQVLRRHTRSQGPPYLRVHQCTQTRLKEELL